MHKRDVTSLESAAVEPPNSSTSWLVRVFASYQGIKTISLNTKQLSMMNLVKSMLSDLHYYVKQVLKNAIVHILSRHTSYSCFVHKTIRHHCHGTTKGMATVLFRHTFLSSMTMMRPSPFLNRRFASCKRGEKLTYIGYMNRCTNVRWLKN